MTKHLKKFSFGDSPEMSEKLLQLVIQGKKTATSWGAVNGDCQTIIEEQMVITDYEDNPKILIETLSLEKIPFNEVTKEFAYAEGEGDRSLSFWREEHKNYFLREGIYSEDMEVYCQVFKVIEVF